MKRERLFLSIVNSGLSFQMEEVVLKQARELVVPQTSEILFEEQFPPLLPVTTLTSLEGAGNNDHEYFIGCWKGKESF